jgi:hypothetical protein
LLIRQRKSWSTGPSSRDLRRPVERQEEQDEPAAIQGRRPVQAAAADSEDRRYSWKSIGMGVSRLKGSVRQESWTRTISMLDCPGQEVNFITGHARLNLLVRNYICLELGQLSGGAR